MLLFNPMAAAASSSSQAKYDVFLSFRGDTRHTFTSHLYAALCRKNIKTFIDEVEIKKGNELSPILLDAIEGSKISIVIFSKKYASSRWCLNELLKIIECKNTGGQSLLPVFYRIDPSHVRKQSGTYEIAFAKHERDNQAKVPEWRMALYEAANCVGWDSSNTRLESELVESIVEDVLQKLNYMINPQVPYGLVGIHKQIEHIESLLCNGLTNVCILGIWGMGGIGKTTIADVLFKKLSPHFDSCCFIENVKEELKIHGKFELRNKLLTQILEDIKLYICTPSMHSTFIVDRLQRRKVLLVLDDVSDSHQIEDLIGENVRFGLGSVIIVTTRNKDVLMNENSVIYYKVMPLDDKQALHLFSLKAFQQVHPKKEFKQVSNMIINYAKGLPLALKVLGSLLYSKNLGEWEVTLEKLKKVPNAKIHHVLSLSYEGLDSDEKNIFLDIACCLKGEEKCRIKNILDGCGFFAKIGLRGLENKSLISISSNGTVNMHDMIQAMGQQIVREESIKEPCRRSRLWDPEEIYQIFKHKLGIYHSVESISLDISKIKDVEICSEAFARMPNLRLLKFYRGWNQRHTRSNLRISKDFAFLLEELRYLKWHSFPLKALPVSFHGEMLVVLDLSYSLIERLWDNEQDLNNLKSLFLSHCKHLIELPNLSNAKKLEEIMLIGCESLRHVPSSIFSLDHLLALDMTNCKELQCIRSDIHSKSLQWVNLEGCLKLVEFSVISEKLEYLNLSNAAIEELPSLTGQGRNLFHLHIFGCNRLNTLPDNFYQMGLDTSIRIIGCGRLQKMPPIIETSPYIRKLELTYCSLTELPVNLGLLSALNELHVKESRIETLPASIKLLSKLRILNVSNCNRLRSLPELPRFLQWLFAYGCSSLEIVLGSAAATLIQNCFGSQNKRLLLRQFHESNVHVDYMNYKGERFDFTNCIKLNENGRKVIMDEAINRIKSAACTSLMLLAYRDPYHPFHLLFKDSHFQITHSIRREPRTCSNYSKWKSSVDSNWHWHSAFARVLRLSKKEKNTDLNYDSKHRFWVEEQEGSFISSFDQLWYNDVCVLMPVSSIPRWFRYRAKGYQVTIRLHPSFHLLGVAFYLVISPFRKCVANFSLEFHNKGARIDVNRIITISLSTSDTVALFYSSRVSNKILEAVKESIANDKSANCNMEISFRFYWLSNSQPHEILIEECGVWPIYASDLEDENKKKLKKKRKRSLVLWNWKCRWQALIMRKKKNYFFKHRNETKLSSTSSSRVKERMPKSWNELQQLLPSKKSKRSQDIDELARGTSGIAAVGGFHHDN